MLRPALEYFNGVRHHDFTEPQRLLVLTVIEYSLIRSLRADSASEFRMIVNEQQVFCQLCGLRKSKVSEELSWLHRQSVVESGSLDRGWLWFALLPTIGWRVPLRVSEASELVKLERWLEETTPDQPELIPPDPTLNEMLRVDFVERQRGNSRVEPGAVRSSAMGISSSPAGNQVESKWPVGRLWAAVEDGMRAEPVPPQGTATLKVPPQGTARVPPQGTATLKVPPQGTARVPQEGTPARVEPDNRSRYVSVQSNRLIDRGYREETEQVRNEARQRAEGRLFRLIGENERKERCAMIWFEAIDRIPARLEELIGHVEMLQREHRLNTRPAAWLNVSVRNALALMRVKPVRPG